MRLHAFVAMPFGKKKAADGGEIDFNRVYLDYIKPALEAAGFEVFRADEEVRAGDIRVDMFQELLIADLVVADLTLDNPNVWYELGVRHALRARGVVLVQSARAYQPFDIYTDRKLHYRLTDGVPDPQSLEQDRAALATMARATVDSSPERKISPVYSLLAYLEEPQWKALRVGAAKEFWAAFEQWDQRLAVARKRGRPGDILVLADEAPTLALRLEAYRKAGAELRALGEFKFALEQYDKALAIDPADPVSRREKGLLLGRIGRIEAAQEWFQAMTETDPSDAEACAYAGRIEKDAWVARWRAPGKDRATMRADAAYEDALLREAIAWYAKGFRARPDDAYPGVNAVALMHLLRHLTGDKSFDDERTAMEGGVRWATRARLARDPRNFWARMTAADLLLMTGEGWQIERAYKDALAVAEGDWFALNSVRQQLSILRDLEFRPPETGVALAVVERTLANIEAPRKAWMPRRVLLFSGHMIDRKDRPQPRFPADKTPIAAQAIGNLLDKLGVGEGDLGICGAACGGDLLFAEVMLARGGRLDLRIAYDEPTFLARSVTFDKSPADAPDDWRERYYAVKRNPRSGLLVMPDELGPTPKGINDYERLNLWQLYSALSYGEDKVHFVCLWNRQGGDGPGGTRHMHDEVARRTGQVHVLDTTRLW